MATTEPTNKVPTNTPHAVPVNTEMKLLLEIAAVSAAIPEAEDEKKRVATEFNAEIKMLKKRLRELQDELRNLGTQLSLNFGSTIKTARALAQSAPADGDADPVADLEERVSDLEAEQDDKEGPTLTRDDDDEATH